MLQNGPISDESLENIDELPVAAWFERHFFSGNVMDAYDLWPQPHTIISDGAYGVGGFPGDPRTPSSLQEWYQPHIQAWSRVARPSTTLWFWNTEIGWATVHPILQQYGWEYVETIVWDKGVAHVAGNVNGETIRQFPVVSEICVFYRRRLEFPSAQGPLLAKQWLRYEWQRSGLPLNKANEACGVRNAATRKYLTQDWLWYFPPADTMERLVTYANEFGDPQGRPYYSLDGETPISADEWAQFRHSWTHQHGITNVWQHPPVNGTERYRGNGIRTAPRVYNPGKNASLHLSQKPLAFMERIIHSSTKQGEVVWEPFGGLCTGSVAAIELERDPYTAEQIEIFHRMAQMRLRSTIEKKSKERSPLDKPQNTQ